MWANSVLETRSGTSLPKDMVFTDYSTQTRSSGGYIISSKVTNPTTLLALQEAEATRDRPGSTDVDAFFDALEHNEGL